MAERVTPRIATSGALMIGVKEVPPMPPSEEIVNVAPLMSSAAELALARLARQLGQLGGDLGEALAVGVLDHRDDEPVGRVGGEADVVVALEHQLVAVQRGVERRGTP